MAYAKRTVRFRRSRRTLKRRPTLAVKTRSRRVAVARKSRVDKLSRQVSSLLIAKYGSPQVHRQNFRALDVALINRFLVSSQKPVCFLNEGIMPGNRMWAAGPTGGVYEYQQIGSWATQTFPLLNADPLSYKFDLQYFRNQKNLGWNGTYLMKGVAYDFQLYAKAAQGYIQCYMITPRNCSVVATDEQVRKLPYCIPSFVNMCKGCDSMYDHSSQFFKIKLMWTEYFNCANKGTVEQRELQTNPLRHRRMYIGMGKRGKLITATDAVPSAILNPVTQDDIPTGKQSWILFTSSINTSDVDLQHFISVQAQRTVYWRDSAGSK